MSGMIATAHRPTREMIVMERMAKPQTESRQINMFMINQKYNTILKLKNEKLIENSL